MKRRMIMKTTKRFIAMAAALALTTCAAMPMASFADATPGKVSFTGETTGSHQYTAYRIFNGSASASGRQALGNPTWAGSSSTSTFDTFKGALKEMTVFGGSGPDNDFIGVETVADLCNVLAGYGDNSAKAKAFAEYCAENADTYGFSATSSTTGASTIPLGTDGYYVVKETALTPDTSNHSAKTAYLLGVYDAASGAEIAVKTALPTVDKEVSDNGNTKWGETADHAINETYQYKLTANLTADADYKDYNTYRLKFNDKLNDGVSYDGIVSVKVNGKDIPAYTASEKSGYLVAQPTEGDYNLTITIGDIKKYLPAGTTWGDSDIAVEVVYNAHLDSDAVVRKASADPVGITDNNVNSVNLQYSNNPNVTGTGDSSQNPGENENPEEFGQTPDDYVWVFTYEVDNTKYANSIADGNKLAGAGFKLYDSTGANEIGLIYDSGLSAYRPVTGTETATEMRSAASTGKFDIKGLDAGTYVLKETTTPDGYDTCAPIEITINPTHQENADKGSAKLTWSATNATNDVINKTGKTLPTTGGMGTTLFILGGGCAAGLAGIYLVSKKRAKEDAE
jgi:fimbrial isopeptide formation D2 family protein/LPXTG-motif cell wall-anchored protein